MKTNNVSAPTFGTKIDIGVLQQCKLAEQSTNFLDGIILAGADATRNGVNDSLLIKLSRKNPQNTGNGLADAFANFAPKAVDQLELHWSSPKGKKQKIKAFDLSDLNKKTAIQIKKLILGTIKKFQPKYLQAQLKKPERLRAKDVIKHADLVVQASPERHLEISKPSKKAEKAFYLVSKYGVDDTGTY